MKRLFYPGDGVVARLPCTLWGRAAKRLKESDFVRDSASVFSIIVLILQHTVIILVLILVEKIIAFSSIPSKWIGNYNSVQKFQRSYLVYDRR